MGHVNSFNTLYQRVTTEQTTVDFTIVTGLISHLRVSFWIILHGYKVRINMNSNLNCTSTRNPRYQDSQPGCRGAEGQPQLVWCHDKTNQVLALDPVWWRFLGSRLGDVFAKKMLIKIILVFFLTIYIYIYIYIYHQLKNKLGKTVFCFSYGDRL